MGTSEGVRTVAHARYQQIADRLRDQITAGVFGPGERLPSEPDLIEEYQASRNTVRLAIALLTNQGLVVTRQGLGTFVQQPTRPFTALLSRVNVRANAHPADPPLSEVHHADTALPVVGAAADQPERARSVVVEKAEATASVAASLDIKPGDPVVVRRSQRYLGEVPWLLVASFFPMDLASGTALEQAGAIEQGSIKLLADLGYPQRGFRDEIAARMPDAREFQFFGLTTGTPVIVVGRTAYDECRPIRLTRYVYRADRVRLAHEVAVVPEKYQDVDGN
jgi:GntR family transcriptional regulator